MITIKDLFELTGDKMINDIQKSFIRRKYAPDVAEQVTGGQFLVTSVIGTTAFWARTYR